MDEFGVKKNLFFSITIDFYVNKRLFMPLAKQI